jgi:hypothetical protein
MALQRRLRGAVFAGCVAFSPTMLIPLPTLGVIGASLGHVALNAVGFIFCLVLL